MARFIVTPTFFAGVFRNYDFTATMTAELKQKMEEHKVLTMEETGENEEFLRTLINPELQAWHKEVSEIKEIEKNIESNPNLIIKGDDIYYKGIDVALPKNLAEELINNPTTALVNFWYWLSQVPNVAAREKLYPYILREKLTILDSGMLLCGRRVVKVSSNSSLVEYAQKTYLKRRSSKKSTNVEVYLAEGEYNLTKGEPQGNLKDLYSKKSELKYTDKHTHKLDYRIGVENRMSRDVCDHSGGYGPSFYNGGPGFCFNGFGDTPTLTIVNPKDLIEICDNSTKFKSCAFTIVAVVSDDLEYQNDENIQKMISEIEFKFEENERIDGELGLLSKKDKPSLTNYKNVLKNIIKEWDETQ